MVISESDWHHAGEKLHEVLDERAATTVMAALPREAPATKTDLDALATRLDHRFEAIDHRFEVIDHRFEAIDHRFGSLDGRFGSLDGRFESLDRRFESLDATLRGQTDRYVRWMLAGMGVMMTVFGTLFALA